MRAASHHLFAYTTALAIVAGSSGIGQAADEIDPLAELAAIDAAELSNLSGRQGISINDQDLAAITQGGAFAAGDDITTGVIDFGSSMQGMSGINNQAINTGNNASVTAGMALHINFY